MQDNKNNGRPYFIPSSQRFNQPNPFDDTYSQAPQPYFAFPMNQANANICMPQPVMAPRPFIFPNVVPHEPNFTNPRFPYGGYSEMPRVNMVRATMNASQNYSNNDQQSTLATQFINLIKPLSETVDPSKSSVENTRASFAQAIREVARGPPAIPSQSRATDPRTASLNDNRPPIESLQPVESRPVVDSKPVVESSLAAEPTPVVEPKVVDKPKDIIVVSPQVHATENVSNGQKVETKPDAFKITKGVAAKKVEPEPPLVKETENISISDNIEKDDSSADYIIGKVVNGRRIYSISELFSARSFELSNKTPQELIASAGKESYIQIRIKQHRATYVRSKGAWVGFEERKLGLSTSEQKICAAKLKIQLSLNKFTRKTQNIVFDEISTLVNEEIIVDFLVERIHKYIISSGAWVSEMAELCVRISEKLFSSDYNAKNLEGSKNSFRNKLVSKVFEGTKVTEDFIQKYIDLKSRVPKTVEELDDLNEELQTLERAQRVIVTSSASFLGWLYNTKIYTEDQANVFLRDCLTNITQDFDVEMICSFLATIHRTKRTKTKKDDPLFILISFLKEDKPKRPLRLQFMVDEVLNLYDKTSKGFKENQATSSGSKDKDMTPHRPPATRISINTASNNKFDILNKPNLRNVRVSNADTSNRHGYHHNASSNIHHQPYRPKGRETKVIPQNVPVEVKFDANTAFHHLVPVLANYAENYNVQDFIANLMDMEISNHMAVFVEKTFAWVQEGTKINYVYFGQLLTSLFNGGRMNHNDIIEGFKNFMDNINDIIIDFPGVFSCIARVFLPLVVYEFVNLSEILEIVKSKCNRRLQQCTVEFFEGFNDFTCFKTTKQIFDNTQIDENTRKMITERIPRLSLPEPILSLSFTYDKITSNVIQMTINIPDVNYQTFDSRYDEILKEFCNLVHFSCPPTPTDVSRHLSKAIGDNVKFVSYLLNSVDRLEKFYNYLDRLLVSRSKLPYEFTRFITQSLVDNNICDLSLVETVLKELGKDDFVKEVSLVKKNN